MLFVGFCVTCGICVCNLCMHSLVIGLMNTLGWLGICMHSIRGYGNGTCGI